jgi:LCP family protein required for cell wall assembly
MRHGGGGNPAHSAAARGQPPPRSAAQRRLPEHFAAARQARRRRVVLATCAALSGLVLLVSGATWSLATYINGSLGRIAAGTAGGGPRGPLNVLVAGVDLRTGLTPRQERALHVGHDISTNSDTLMLVHISADRSRVVVVSFPRDSWVDIPGHGMNKINSAFGLGGPKLMVATVEHDTGLTINHYIEVNFLGFVRVIDALGGVNICLPQAVKDRYSGLRLAAGVHHVNGITALKYARDRHSFPMSDLARIDHQQSLLASLLREAISSHTLANPIRLSQVLRAGLSAVRVDSDLDVTSLADQLRGISLQQVQFLTVPLASVNYVTKTGESAVLWKESAARLLFAKLKADVPLSARAPRRGSRQRHAGGHHPAAQPAPGADAVTPGTRTAAQDACK